MPPNPAQLSKGLKCDICPCDSRQLICSSNECHFETFFVNGVEQNFFQCKKCVMAQKRLKTIDLKEKGGRFLDIQ